ncbi:hypothetical protein BCR33DRAFT_714480 [Rhizoclosmatium globosum]|uniref:C2H2-type domain-containing protein n=1 Tax=Rhizoclosmatium globosum TaxID=329046 RepID=A0A1Y2CLZ4_9FUNG|nr:hypothetical protein BCR33DRAFT_714480 [Rhizoclosmatium globosum]|eukprot:ORY48032.1 hypothetical protein BCR33DRAFT_714480 [Rhizoclosmatium globosum]
MSSAPRRPSLSNARASASPVGVRPVRRTNANTSTMSQRPVLSSSFGSGSGSSLAAGLPLHPTTNPISAMNAMSAMSAMNSAEKRAKAGDDPLVFAFDDLSFLSPAAASLAEFPPLPNSNSTSTSNSNSMLPLFAANPTLFVHQSQQQQQDDPLELYLNLDQDKLESLDMSNVKTASFVPTQRISSNTLAVPSPFNAIYSASAPATFSFPAYHDDLDDEFKAESVASSVFSTLLMETVERSQQEQMLRSASPPLDFNDLTGKSNEANYNPRIGSVKLEPGVKRENYGDDAMRISKSDRIVRLDWMDRGDDDDNDDDDSSEEEGAGLSYPPSYPAYQSDQSQSSSYPSFTPSYPPSSQTALQQVPEEKERRRREQMDLVDRERGEWMLQHQQMQLKQQQLEQQQLVAMAAEESRQLQLQQEQQLKHQEQQKRQQQQQQQQLSGLTARLRQQHSAIPVQAQAPAAHPIIPTVSISSPAASSTTTATEYEDQEDGDEDEDPEYVSDLDNDIESDEDEDDNEHGTSARHSSRNRTSLSSSHPTTATYYQNHAPKLSRSFASHTSSSTSPQPRSSTLSLLHKTHTPSTQQHHPHNMDPSRSRDYQCPVCHKWFLRRQDLRRHEVTHSKVKAFECPLGCGTTFGRSDALSRHLKARRCVQD